jgi:hypothetical protein
MYSNIFLGFLFLAFALTLYVSFIIYNRIKKKKLAASKNYQMATLISLPDFSGSLKDGVVVRVETGMTFFHDLLDDAGSLVKSFDPDWTKDDIDLFANKHGYNLKYIDF